jgi:hypothetical protein
MPRNFLNILRDNPESWGGRENPLTLPTTRGSDKAQKRSASVKNSAVHFLCNILKYRLIIPEKIRISGLRQVGQDNERTGIIMLR